jgi:hypothetical protein
MPGGTLLTMHLETKMGRLNRHLLREYSKLARKPKTSFDWTFLDLGRIYQEIEVTQENCPHADIRTEVARTSGARVKKGDTVTWCLDCSKLLEVLPKQL